jgi:opacity protein-like surface antigen
MQTSGIRQLFSCGSVVLAGLAWVAPATADGNFYLRPHVGLSMLQDNDFRQSGVAAAGAKGDGEYDTGWVAGLGFGYRYGNGWSAEIDWEYRTNDNDSVNFSDGTNFDDGDIASNIFYLNGYYTFDLPGRGFRPFVGAGVGWVQEIDLDLESGGRERSYSGDGDFAWQIMAGLEADLADSWRLQGELRYTQLAGVDLDAEGGAGRITGLDYDAWSVGIGLVYDF